MKLTHSFKYNGIWGYMMVDFEGIYFYYEDPETEDLIVYELRVFEPFTIAKNIPTHFIVYRLTAKGKKVISSMNAEEVTGAVLRRYKSEPGKPFGQYSYVVTEQEYKVFFDYYKSIIINIMSGLVASLPIWGHDASPKLRKSIRPFHATTQEKVYPVDCKVKKTDESAAGAQDGTITATIDNPIEGQDYEVSIDGGANFTPCTLVEGVPTLVVGGLAPDTYPLTARSTTALMKSIPQDIEILAYAA